MLSSKREKARFCRTDPLSVFKSDIIATNLIDRRIYECYNSRITIENYALSIIDYAGAGSFFASSRTN